MAEADGFSLLYRGLMIVLGLVEFFMPVGLLGHRTLFDWMVMHGDVWFVQHVSADATLELVPPVCAGLAIIFATWLVVSTLFGTLRSIFQREV